jgi:hypothetical protein
MHEFLEESFEAWWWNEGDIVLKVGDYSSSDRETIKRLCRIAWSNGAYKQVELDESQR